MPPGDMKIGEVPWTTSQIFPEAGEVLASAWARALAGNTGWLAFQPEPLPGAHEAGVAAEGTASKTAAAYITAGTWVACAKIAGNIIGAWHGTFLVDGTTIIGSASAGDAPYNMNGTGTFIQDASGWLTITMIGKSVTNAGTFAFAGFYRPCAE